MTLHSDDTPEHGIARLEVLLGHRFADRASLEAALTRAGAARAGGRDNERLEFLGDRVLGLVIAERLHQRFPSETVGELGRRFAVLVDASTLAKVAASINLGSCLVLARGDEISDGRRNRNILADALEATIAALYLDAGLEPARRFILSHWNALIEEAREAPRDPKNALQEYAMARALDLPRYTVLRQDGPPHRPTFEVSVAITGHDPATGTGPSKRAAETEAASLLLKRIAGQTP